MTSYKCTLPYTIPVAIFLALGALSVNTPGLMVLVFIPFLLAWPVVRILNNPDERKDSADYERYGPILEKMNAKTSFTEKTEPLSQEDIRRLQTMTSEGYRFPESYVRKTIQKNQKITYQGYITTKYWDEDGYHISIGKSVSNIIPAETYRRLSLGDYLAITIASVQLTIAIARPQFILKYDVLRKAEELDSNTNKKRVE